MYVPVTDLLPTAGGESVTCKFLQELVNILMDYIFKSNKRSSKVLQLFLFSDVFPFNVHNHALLDILIIVLFFLLQYIRKKRGSEGNSVHALWWLSAVTHHCLCVFSCL